MSRQIVMNLDGKPHIYQEAVRFNTEIWIDKKDGTIEKICCRDLGPVNEAGFLREERSGQYPDISHDKRNGVYEAYLHATLINPAMSAVLVRVQASSMDRLKEAWNRRV